MNPPRREEKSVSGQKVAAGLLAAAALVAAANATLLVKIEQGLPNDWKYFNSLSLVIRSAVLHYRTWPLHNPWVCGGLDILANPQNRIFSPFFAADVLLAPQTANLFSILFYGVLGAWGMFQLLKMLGMNRAGSILGTILFINASWFGLHFLTGHIPYGPMQLLPFSVIALLHLSRPTVILATCVAHAILVLEGGIYAVVYSFMLAVSCVVLFPACRKEAALSLRRHPLIWTGSLAAASLLTAPKTIPALIGLAGVPPRIDFLTMTNWDVTQALFNPGMTIWDNLPEGIWNIGFHEFGCYITLPGIGLIVFAMISDRKFRYAVIPSLMGIAFWFWVASGWLPPINPWHLFHKIPLLNFLHVQSRTFILMYFFFIIAVVMAWQATSSRRTLSLGIFAILVVEAFLVRNMISTVAFLRKEAPPGWNELITSKTITSYVPMAFSPDHYLSRPDTSSSFCYEPSFEGWSIQSSEDPDYKGPAWTDPEDGGTVLLQSFTPGRIAFTYATSKPGARIVFNTNALFGWTLREGEGKIEGKGTELLNFIPEKPGAGTALLVYRPTYLAPSLSLFLCGFGITCTMAWRIIARSRRRPRDEGLERL